jgi:hypothetical protein
MVFFSFCLVLKFVNEIYLIQSSQGQGGICQEKNENIFLFGLFFIINTIQFTQQCDNGRQLENGVGVEVFLNVIKRFKYPGTPGIFIVKQGKEKGGMFLHGLKKNILNKFVKGMIGGRKLYRNIIRTTVAAYHSFNTTQLALQ